MIRLLAICRNTFLQSIRQPIFSILILLTFVFLIFNVPLSGWTMSPTGEHKESDQRLMNNVSLSTILAMGVFVAAFGASSVLSREIEDRTALTVIAKPVSRATFVFGKYLGVAAAVAMAFYLCSLVFLMTVRHQVMPTASDRIDWPVIVLGGSMFALALVISVGGNFTFGWPFTSTMVWACTLLLTAAMAAIAVVGKGWTLVPFGQGISGQLLIALGLIFVAVMFFSAVAVAASTRLGQIPTLLVCIAVAALGAYHPLLFSEGARDNVMINALAWITPDTRYFMMMDALVQDHVVPLAFVAISAAYGLCFIGASLAIGIALFQTRQLQGGGTTSGVPAAIGALAWVGRAVAVACLLAGLILPAWPKFQQWSGLLTAGALLAGGVLGWLLWGFFARGVAWSYWLVAAAATVSTLAALAALLLPEHAAFLRLSTSDTGLSIRALGSATVVLICILPRTRRHFKHTHRSVVAGG